MDVIYMAMDTLGSSFCKAADWASVSRSHEEEILNGVEWLSDPWTIDHWGSSWRVTAIVAGYEWVIDPLEILAWSVDHNLEVEMAMRVD